MNENLTNTCPRHDSLPVIGNCINCGKAICRECRSEFGYFCSGECLAASRGGFAIEEKEEFQRDMETAARTISIVKKVLGVAAIIFAVGIGWFVWKVFLDPAGKLSWRWEYKASSDDFFILRHDETMIVLKSGDSIITVNPKRGKEISRITKEEFLKYNKLIKILPEGALFTSQDSAVVIGFDGNILWEKKFDANVTHASAGESQVLIVRQIEEPQKENEEFPLFRTIFVAADIADGKILWEKESKDFASTVNIGSGSKSFAYTSSGQMADGKYVCILKVVDLKTGKERWQTKLDSFLSWGPKIINEMVIFLSGNNFAAVSEDGRRKLWNFPMKGFFSDEQMKIYGSLLIINGSESFVCIDLQQQKILWQKKIGLFPESFEYASGRIFLTGTTEEEAAGGAEEEVKLPPSFEQIKDHDFLQEGSGDALKKKKKLKGILLCLDAETGNELWRKENVRGEVVADSERLIVVTDMARCYFSVLTIGDKETIVLQLNPKTGKEICKHKSRLATIGPYMIIGRKLVGVEYEAPEGGITSLSCIPGEKYLSLAGFNLK